MDHDMDHAAKLMAAEREKEITQATTLQGQIVALVMLLREKEVFTHEDVDRWEHQAEIVQKFLVEMLCAQEELLSAEDDVDLYRASARAIDLSIQFSTMLGNTDERTAVMTAKRDEMLRMWEAAKAEAEEDDEPNLIVTPD